MGPFAFSLALGNLSRKKKPVAPVVQVIENAPDLLGTKHWRFSEKSVPGEAIHFFLPGEKNRRHVVTLIVATLKHGGTQLLTVQDEGFMALQSYVHGSLNIPARLAIRRDKAVTIYLNCHEDPENVVALTVWGYTEDWLEDEDEVIP